MKHFFTHLLLLGAVLGAYAANLVPPYPASNLRYDRDGGRITGTLDIGGGTTRIVVAKEGSPVTGLPVNGVQYNSNSDFATPSAQFTVAGEYVVARISGTSFTVNKLKPGTTYYFAIFEYNGTGTAIEYLMTPLSGSSSTLSAPTTQAQSISATAVTGNTISLSWLKGAGDNRIVLARKGGGVNAIPQDLTIYTPSDNFGFGSKIGTDNYVVYKTNGSAVTVKNLEPATVYHFSVFEYNGFSTPVHLVPGADFSVSTAAGPDKAPSNLSFTNIDGDRMRVSVTVGNGTRRLFIVRKGQPVSASPVNGAMYNAAADFGNPASEIAPGEFVVGFTTNNFVDITKLEPNTTYHLRVFECDMQTGGYTYFLTSLFASGNKSTPSRPTVLASNIKVTSYSGNSAYLDFTRGNGTYRMVMIREDGPVSAVPADLVLYPGNGTYKTGTEITPGNYSIISSTSSNTITLNNLERGHTYHISIFEYNGSNYPVYSASGAPFEFTMPLEPTTASSAPVVQNREGGSLRFAWTKGTGARRLVIVKKGTTAVLARPADGVIYNANNNFAEGEQPVSNEFIAYDGVDQYFDLKKLEPGTTYKLAVFEYNVGSDGKPDYLTSSFLEGVAATLSAPTTQPGITSVSSIQSSQATVNFTKGNGSHRIFIVKKGSDVTNEPQDLVRYYPSTSFGNTTSHMGDGNYVVFITDNVTPFTITGLQPNTTYYVKAYELNGLLEPVYLRALPATSSFTTSDMHEATTPTSPATNSVVENRDGNKLSLKWTSGNGDRRIVVMKKGSAVAFEPLAGEDYSANAAFATGTDLGGGEYIVYNGNGNSVDITELEPAATYHFRIYEFNGTGTLIHYLTSVFLTGTASTVSAPSNTVQDVIVTAGEKRMTIKWTNGNGSGRLVVVRESGAVSAVPQSLVVYPAGADYKSGAQIAAGQYVVYQGNGNEITVTGLEENKTYHYSIFEYNGINAPVYNPAAVQGLMVITAPLPVRLLFFRAKEEKSRGVLTWATAQEIDNQSFTVEKSNDGRNFHSIMELPGAGNSNQPINYSFTDSSVLIAKTWYRLRQSDKNGHWNYSGIVFINPGTATAVLNVYPNPVQSQLRIEWPGNVEEAVACLYNTSGVKVKQTKVIAGSSLSCSDLRPGTYYLRVLVNDQVYNFSIIKQ